MTTADGIPRQPLGQHEFFFDGKTIATWGEGFSYTGPGGTWFNIQR